MKVRNVTEAHKIKNPFITSAVEEVDYLGDDKPVRVWVRNYYLYFKVGNEQKRVLIYSNHKEKEVDKK